MVTTGFTEGFACDAVGERLEPYLDGELPADEAAPVAAHLERCPACARELDLAARIRRELRRLPELPPPAHLEPRPPQPAAPLTLWGETGGGLRRGLAAAGFLVALVAILVLAGTLVPRREAPPEADAVRTAELARAERQARYALARVGAVARRTGLELRDDVLADHLIAPTTRGVVRGLDRAAAPRHDDPSHPGETP